MKLRVIFVCFTFLFVIGCSKNKTQETGSSLSGGSQGIVAKINDKTITDAEVEKKIMGQLFSIQERIYDMKKEAIEEMVNEYILSAEAKKANKTEDQLVDEYSKTQASVSDDEVTKFYERVKDNPRLTGTDEEKKNKIKEYLLDKKKSRLKMQYMEELRKNYKVEVMLPEPQLPEIPVVVGDSPVDGPENAAVTIVEFSDYECPFCARMEETIQNIKKKYKDDVRIVFRDFPLSMHENAQTAAEAANCAIDQGKFWEYHNILFEKNRERKEEMVKDNLIKWAETLGIDMVKFKECVETHKYKSAVETDINYGKEIGISATPTIFVNGKMLSGSKPFSYIDNLVQKEIEKKKPGSAAAAAATTSAPTEEKKQ